ncbi:MAG: heavy-metal-associated domain-containing protein [Chromatiales bacterium]
MFKTAVTASLFWLATVVHADPVAYGLQVDGLACPFCVHSLKKRLSAVEGVERVEADLKEGKVVVTVKDEVTLSEQVREAVKEAGFTLCALSRETGP